MGCMVPQKDDQKKLYVQNVEKPAAILCHIIEVYNLSVGMLYVDYMYDVQFDKQISPCTISPRCHFLLACIIYQHPQNQKKGQSYRIQKYFMDSFVTAMVYLMSISLFKRMRTRMVGEEHPGATHRLARLLGASKTIGTLPTSGGSGPAKMAVVKPSSLDLSFVIWQYMAYLRFLSGNIC